MKARLLTTLLAAGALLATLPATAQFGSMVRGTPGMQGGGGMLVVADDGSVLVTRVGFTQQGGPAAPKFQRALYDLEPDGTQRWTTTFQDGWPMTPVTQGDLVVVPVVSNSWTGTGNGDTGWKYGNGLGNVSASDHVTLVGFDLATGDQLWSTDLDGNLASEPQFSGDGAQLYVSVFAKGANGAAGQSSISQSSAGGAASLTATSVICVDRTGTVLWTKDLSGAAMAGAN